MNRKHCDCPEGRCLQDAVADYMIRNGMTVTFDSWKNLNWGVGQPDPWTDEHDEDVPACLRQSSKSTLEVPPAQAGASIPPARS